MRFFSSTRFRRLQGVPYILFLTVLLLAGSEWSIGYMRGLGEHPSSYLEPRNPNYIRGWVDYTALGPVKHKGFQVIVISNSQGFLRENPNGALSYPQQLEVLLRNNGYGEDAEVLNWSIPGGACREEILLAARSVAHKPDVVILASYNNDFAPSWEHSSLSSIRSDILNLAYLPEVRKCLPRSFLHQARAYNPQDWLKANSQCLAWHNRFVGPERLWSVPQRLQTAFMQQEFLTLSQGVSPTLLGQFVDAAHAGPIKPKVLFVSMPLNAKRTNDFRNASYFAAVANAVAKTMPGVECLDASKLIPSVNFYSARHMQPKGHEQFSLYLLAHLPPPGT